MATLELLLVEKQPSMVYFWASWQVYKSLQNSQIAKVTSKNVEGYVKVAIVYLKLVKQCHD
jgi:hypothetical protein